MIYHVIKVMAVKVPGFKELVIYIVQDLQEQKRSSPYILDIHSKFQMLTSAMVQ